MTLTDRPLAAFDLETTGPNPHVDRIVTANLTTIATDPNGVVQINGRNWLLDPGIEIPEGAAAVHGITTEQARDNGQDYATGLAEIGLAVADAWNRNHVLVVYNASFDMTMLHHEHLRVFPEDVEGRKPVGFPAYGTIVDPFVIDKAFDQYRKGKRTLTAACEHYGVKLGNAHEAEADAIAAARLAWVMLRRYNLDTASHEQIMREQTRWYAEQADGLARYWRKKARSLSGEEREQLLAQVATIRTEWPIANPTTQKETAA